MLRSPLTKRLTLWMMLTLTVTDSCVTWAQASCLVTSAGILNTVTEALASGSMKVSVCSLLGL